MLKIFFNPFVCISSAVHLLNMSCLLQSDYFVRSLEDFCVSGVLSYCTDQICFKFDPCESFHVHKAFGTEVTDVILNLLFVAALFMRLCLCPYFELHPCFEL